MPKSVREVQIILFAVPCVLFVVSFTAMCQESTPSSGEVLTLEQAVALALNNNRLIEITELEVKK